MKVRTARHITTISSPPPTTKSVSATGLLADGAGRPCRRRREGGADENGARIGTAGADPSQRERGAAPDHGCDCHDDEVEAA
jgi:hypothetical protein